MITHKLIVAASLLAAVAMPSTAAAQGYDDLEESASSSSSSAKSSRRGNIDQEVREIVKGSYAKTNIGGAIYLGQFAGFVNPGTSVALAFGQDFVDQETTSMAWEVAFFQGIHNGCHYTYQSRGLCPGAPGEPAPFVQGDLRTYTITGLVEWSYYPNRRIGLGVRAGGGVLYSPLLMDEEYYQSDVVSGEWGNLEPGYHDSPHPIVMGGPTFEYYTKLSHFSVGADVDGFYAVGFDLGLSMTGYLKYTF